MAALGAYNRWLHERFDRFLGQRVLEVGSGIGNQTQYLTARAGVVAAEPDPRYVRELQRRFEDHAQVRVVGVGFPLSEPDRADLQAERLDTVVCMNVLEHIEDDRRTLDDLASVLPPGGRLVLVVPAMPGLYGSLDRALGHFRRYDRAGLMALVSAAGFVVQEARFLNRPGVAGWWLNARLLRRRLLPAMQLRLFTWLMPLLRLEARQTPRFGLSLLVLATKGRGGE
jgi:2-polyprenyl-3-methyl-5-hydroxy-6-metoxy-1,4-benzoquinol methylase